MDVLFKIESLETFTEIMKDVLQNLYDLNHIPASKTVDFSSIKSAKEEIKNIILETNLNTSKVRELLCTKYPNNEERVRSFVSLLEDKRRELLNLMVIHYNCAFGETLNTFDWKLSLVCGTSELKTFSYPLLHLALYTVSVEHKPAVKLYEINKDMLFRLIGILEDILGDPNTN